MGGCPGPGCEEIKIARGACAPPASGWVCTAQQQQVLPQLHPQLLPQLQPQLHPQLHPLPQPQPISRIMIRMIQMKPLSLLFRIVCHLTYQSETYYAGRRQKAA